MGKVTFIERQNATEERRDKGTEPGHGCAQKAVQRMNISEQSLVGLLFRVKQFLVWTATTLYYVCTAKWEYSLPSLIFERKRVFYYTILFASLR